MKLKKLQFENFRSFTRTEIQFPDYPVVVIYDENGRGKTTIQEGVLWSLSGELYRYNRDDLKSEYGTIDAFYSLRAGDKSRIQLIMELEDENGDKLVTRINRPKRRKTYLTPSLDLDLQYYFNGSNLTQNEFNDVMVEILNVHPRQFQTTNFLSQEIINEALVIDENIRANVFSQLLSFDWMQDINSHISDEIKELRKIKRSLQHEKLKLNERLGDTEINRLWKQLQEQIDDLKDQGLDFKNSDKITILDYLSRVQAAYNLLGIDDKEEELKKYLDGDNDLTTIDVDQLKSYQEDIDNRIKELENQLGQLTNKVELAMNESESIITSVKEYKNQEKLIENMTAEISSKIKSRKTMDEQLEQLQKNKDELEKEINNLTELSKQYYVTKEKRDKVIEALGDIDEITETMENEKDNISRLKNTKDKLIENKKKVLEQQDRIAKLQDDLNDLETQIEELDNKNRSNLIQEIEPVIDEIEKTRRYLKDTDEIDNIMADIIDIDLNEPEKIDLKLIINKLDTLQNEFSKIPKNAEIERLIELQEAIESQEGNEKRRDNLEEVIESYETTIENKRTQKEMIKEKYQPIENKLDTIEDRSNFAMESKIAMIVTTILFGTLGIVSSSISFVFFGLSLISATALLLLVLPDIWVNINILDSPLASLISNSKYSEMLKDNHRRLSDSMMEVENEINQALEKKMNAVEEVKEIDRIDQRINNLPSAAISTLDQQLEAYNNISTYLERIEYLKDYISDLIAKEAAQDKKQELIKRLKETEETLQNSLDTDAGDIDYDQSLDQITSQINGTIVDLEEAIKEKDALIQKLVDTKKEMKDWRQNLDDLEAEITDTHDIVIEDIEDTLSNWNKKSETLEEKINDINEKRSELIKEIQDLQDDKSKVDTEHKSTSHYLDKHFNSLNIDDDELSKDTETIIENVKSKFDSFSKTYDDKEERSDKLDKINSELGLLNEYFTNLQLLQETWNEKQEEIVETEDEIRAIEAKLENLNDLEESWKLVSDSLQESTEDISGDVVQVIKQDVNDYFELLGGHQTLSHVDLDIRVLRNKLNASINVGLDDELSGSPKVLFSNGEQVALILSLFFAMSRQILKKSKIQWVGLDEPTQYLDSSRKADFVDFVHVFVEENPELQLVITTADREFIEMLDHKTEEIFHITSIRDIASTEFSDVDYKSTSELISTGDGVKLDRQKSHVEVELPELTSDITISTDRTTPKPLGSIDIIDEMPEGKEYKCSVCRQTFKALTHKEVCDSSECIREYKNTMFNL